MNILITGAGGFIGSSLCNILSSKGHCVKAVYREVQQVNKNVQPIYIPDINDTDNLLGVLKKVDVVIHLAARAHISSDTAINPLEVFRKTNTEGTLKLAIAAAESGVRRFIFISSIGVNGNTSSKPFNEQSKADPHEHYAISKFEAEQGLKQISERTGMELVIVRPPLVYGNHCPGNFLRLLEMVYKGLPLPLEAINNKRSLIHVDNLSNFLMLCAEHPLAADQLFLIADEPDISIPSIIAHLAKGMNRPTRLFSLPYQVIHFVAKLAGKQMTFKKLCGDLQIDSSFARKTLDWHQPISLEDGLQKVGKQFVEK